MKKIIALFIVAAFAGNCFGVAATQNSSTNLVKAAVASKTPPPKWLGTITVGLTATAGNINSVLLTSKILADKKGPHDVWHLEADGTYGEADDVKSAETAHGSAQYNHNFIDDTWYAYARADALHDAIADVAYRFTGSPGVGYYFIKNKMTTLSSEAGPAVEMEKLDDHYHTYPTARVAENFEHKLDEHARVWENMEIVPPITDPQAFLINSEIGVETPLTHNISLQAYVQDNFANEPAPGFQNNDVKLVSGLVFKF